MMIKEDNKRTAYELWFLGDIHDRGLKGRETFDRFLVEAGSLLQICRDEKISVGGVEIVEVDMDGNILESVWSMNVDEFEKVSR
tara:strand:+ start:90 stop:341 length:252 start_codon:yes stop_codon:yes gene_type:complete